ncbi:hypothetical protein NIES2130_27815 [Scytonema sp. HK-05]|nr:hypothetical protein [Scytonema sp. HK-05]OKH54853.1 hypothetical protein NIES2130_27815 [Scytonema sp. HK-05]
MNNCPCCSSPLLRHIRHQEVYWFCRSCWQAMPVFSQEKCTSLPEVYVREFPTKLEKREKSNVLCLNERGARTGWIGV